MPNNNKTEHFQGIYLDHAAASPCREKYLRAFTEYSLRFPGNQEAMSYHGSLCAHALQEASCRILECFKVSSRTHEVHFCNTGTECAIASVRALCMTLKKSFSASGEIVTTALEHPALLQSLKRDCALFGFELKICPAGKQGVRMDELERLLSDRTLAVAVHHVESQTGSVMDLSGLRNLMKKNAPKALLLSDTVQSAGKLALSLETGPDLIFISGQKLAVPSCGAVICRSVPGQMIASLRRKEHFFGRSTPAAILTLADALEEQVGSLQETGRYVSSLGRLLDSELQKYSLKLKRTLPADRTSPYIAHYLSTPYQGAILTRALHQYRISAAPGSACESETPGGSAALSAMGFPPAECYCGLRFSFSRENTPEEIRECAEKLSCCIRDY